jgi:hypothetical protein
VSVPISCMVGLLVLVGGKQQHLNVQLNGFEVRYIASDRSLVDFSANISKLGLKVLQPTVFAIDTNLCQYRTEQVTYWNTIDSNLTQAEREWFAMYSARGVAPNSSQTARFLKTQ